MTRRRFTQFAIIEIMNNFGRECQEIVSNQQNKRKICLTEADVFAQLLAAM
jgi:hypothetical protein